LGFYFGKFTTLGGDANEFAAGRGDTQFLSHPFLGASVTALFNPYSTVGGGVILMPTPELTLSSSLFASTDSSSKPGLDTFDDGLISSTTVNWQYEIGSLPGGMRGTYQYAFNQDFVNFKGTFVTLEGLSIPRTNESWCFFWNGWQYLYTEEKPTKPINISDGRTDLQGLGIFLRAATADQETNPIEWIVSGGIGGRGLIPTRDNDTFGIGYAYSSVSRIPIASRRLIDGAADRFEAYYTIALLPSVELMFDLQCADSLRSKYDPALLLGMRLRVAF